MQYSIDHALIDACRRAAWSRDGFQWSNISGANGVLPERMVGPFNLTRPYKAANGTVVNASYYTPRPKVRRALPSSHPPSLPVLCLRHSSWKWAHLTLPSCQLLLAADGTPTHLYNSAAPAPGQGSGSFTVAQPLGAAKYQS
jgi:hypothetical protein